MEIVFSVSSGSKLSVLDMKVGDFLIKNSNCETVLSINVDCFTLPKEEPKNI